MDGWASLLIQFWLDPESTEAGTLIITAIQRVTDRFTPRRFTTITLATAIAIGVAWISTEAVLTECIEPITIEVTLDILAIFGVEAIRNLPLIRETIAIIISTRCDGETPLRLTANFASGCIEVYLIGADDCRGTRLFFISTRLVSARRSCEEAAVNTIVTNTIITVTVIT